MKEFRIVVAAAAVVGAGLLLSLPFRTDVRPAESAPPRDSELAWRGGDLLQVHGGATPIGEEAREPSRAGSIIGTPVVVRAGSVERTPVVPRLDDSYRPAFELAGDAGAAAARTPSPPSGSARVVPPAGPAAATHRIRDGDSLEKIARRYLGSEEHARWLFDANRDRLARPDVLPLNIEIRIPALPESHGTRSGAPGGS